MTSDLNDESAEPTDESEEPTDESVLDTPALRMLHAPTAMPEATTTVPMTAALRARRRRAKYTSGCIEPLDSTNHG
jgi:hypothetical protein